MSISERKEKAMNPNELTSSTAQIAILYTCRALSRFHSPKNLREIHMDDFFWVNDSLMQWAGGVLQVFLAGFIYFLIFYPRALGKGSKFD